MRCASCGSENPAGKNFCGDCGAELSNRCPRCGSVISDSTKFCRDCGAEVGVEDLPLTAGLDSSGGLEGARRGQGQIVAAVGEAGMGKSRLFHEFKSASQPGWMVLEAFSVSHGKTSADLPVIDLLKNYFE